MILFGSSAMNCSPGLFSTAGYAMFGSRYQTVRRDTTEKDIDSRKYQEISALKQATTTSFPSPADPVGKGSESQINGATPHATPPPTTSAACRCFLSVCAAFSRPAAGRLFPAGAVGILKATAASHHAESGKTPPNDPIFFIYGHRKDSGPPGQQINAANHERTCRCGKTICRSS